MSCCQFCVLLKGLIEAIENCDHSRSDFESDEACRRVKELCVEAKEAIALAELDGQRCDSKGGLCARVKRFLLGEDDVDLGEPPDEGGEPT